MMIEMSDAEYTISMLSYKKYSKVIVDFPDITVGSIRKVSILVDGVEFLEMEVDAFSISTSIALSHSILQQTS